MKRLRNVVTDNVRETKKKRTAVQVGRYEEKTAVMGGEVDR